MKTCRICGKKAQADFNIELKRTSICESCANAITWQQMESLIREKNANMSYQELVHGMDTTNFPVTKGESSGAIAGVAPKSGTRSEKI